jgi:ABC-type branched-subunit amino acid transport system ATPase component
MMSSMEGNSDVGKLIVQHVSKHFAGLRAVDEVSLEVREGKILGLIGPNGSGKTTLLNLISGLLPVTGGRVLLDETDITGWAPHRIAGQGIGRTFQTVHLFSALTVLENVEVAAVGVGMSRRRAGERARALLKEFDMEEVVGLPAGTLAFGQQRRVEVARALAMAPRFMLLDEPAAGLNEGECDELLGLLASIRDKIACGMLVVDHDMRLIMRLCDRVHVLNYGRTIAEGTCEEVSRNPEVIEAYLGSAEEEGQVAGLQ